AELQQALLDVARGREWASRGAMFRMPIDRVFSVAGHGTVVTGSVLGGEVRSGDVLELLPAQVSVRVRGVQSHGAEVDESSSRQRTAINLAGVKADDVHRGQELAAPGLLQPTRRLLVRLKCLASSPVALRDRLPVGLHLGTGETAARLVLKGATIEPGASGYAELRIAEPVVAAWGQRFILRRQSPPLTIAGGTVLDPGVEPRARIADLAALGQALDSTDEGSRLSACLATRDRIDETPLTAAWKVGIDPARYATLVERLRSQGVLVPIGSASSRRLVHKQRVAAVAETVLRRIGTVLEAHQPRRSLPRKMLQTACRRLATAELLDAAFDRLLADNKLVRVGPNLGPADAQVKLSKNQTAARAKMLELIQQGGLAPPNAKELVQVVGQKAEMIEPLLVLCVEDGRLVEVGDGLYYPPGALESARKICEATLAGGTAATMSQLREAWKVTRKYSVPLCEWFDANGLTIREGDLRRAGPGLGKPLVE
ncbi:MAG: SelB C-terminal domain-containing protein, partial [Planctomycetia bacterium]|nr:SelB C-terminal domain-containing protein [Planctomycetia bacterium]